MKETPLVSGQVIAAVAAGGVREVRQAGPGGTAAVG